MFKVIFTHKNELNWNGKKKLNKKEMTVKKCFSKILLILDKNSNYFSPINLFKSLTIQSQNSGIYVTNTCKYPFRRCRYL